MKIIMNLKKTNIEGELIEGEAVPFGNSAHIVLPKKYLNRKLRIIFPTKEIPIDDEEGDDF